MRETKSNASMQVEFMAGTDIKEAIAEASEKARRFDLAYVKFDFNGIKMSVGRNADAKQAINDFNKALNGDGYKFVVAN